jgi:hypothetical protein
MTDLNPNNWTRKDQKGQPRWGHALPLTSRDGFLGEAQCGAFGGIGLALSF